MAKNTPAAETAADVIPTSAEQTVQTDAAKRQAVAKREYIDADGAVVEREELATGISYTDLATGRTFTWQTGGDAGSAPVMLACFGALTLAGNVRNTWDKTTGEREFDNAIDAIEARFRVLTEGKWLERGTGVARGPKYDNTILAAAVHQFLGDKARGDKDDYFNRLESDKSYRAKVLTSDAVKRIYAELAGKPTVAVSEDDLA